jgi:tRNA (guanine-N7-)-methyltransferase
MDRLTPESSGTHMARGRVKRKPLQEGPPSSGPQLTDVLVPLELMAECLDFPRLFGNHGPVEVEIGSGKGGFLIEAAKSRPSHNFLGIEYVEKFALYIADRVVRHGLTNVRILSADASHLFIHRMPPGSIDLLHVYHPDPWPKKRHHKRRLFQPAFVDAAIRALKPAGLWYIQTDHADYFEVMKAVTLDRPDLQPVDFASQDPASGSPVLQTNFAVRYGQGGESIHQLAFRRKA